MKLFLRAAPSQWTTGSVHSRTRRLSLRCAVHPGSHDLTYDADGVDLHTWRQHGTLMTNSVCVCGIHITPFMRVGASRLPKKRVASLLTVREETAAAHTCTRQRQLTACTNNTNWKLQRAMWW